MDTTKIYDILKIKDGEVNIVEDLIILEYPFTIFIDDEEIITLLCTPKSLKELTLGFLFSESFIETLDSVDRVQIDEINGRAYVYLKVRKSFNEKFQGKRTITSGCGKGTVFYNVIDSFKSKKIENNISLDYSKIVELVREFNQRSELFLTTGGVHSCALCSMEEILYFEEDIGRHNALDKILGKALLDNLDLSDKMVVSSGRISSEMLIKVAKRGIPAIISRSAPTSLAVEMARQLNIALIGFVRGQKLNMYSSFPSLKF